MNLRVLGMVISIFVIAFMVFVTINTNFKTNDASKEVEEYPSGLITDLPDELVDSRLLDHESGLAINEKAPDFELVTLTGEKVRLSDYKGQKVVLNFWASWCPPCRVEMPHMENYYQKYKELDEVEILAVNMTKTEIGDRENIEGFIDKYELTFPIPLDEDGAVMDLYKVRSFPTTYFINAEGIITDIVWSAINDLLLKEYVENSQ